MPDISMCADDECPARHKCRRHKASGTVPSEYQQAFTDFQRQPKDQRCPQFWPNVTGRAALDEMVKLSQEMKLDD
jgi:hypothetical protein